MGKLWLLGLVTAVAWSGEYAVLGSGAWLYADRHEDLGETVRLHRGAGWIDLPAAAVVRFEPIEVPATPSRPSQPTLPVSDVVTLLRETAERYGGAEFALLAHSVAKVESGYRADAVSPKGARGLMQLMPETARALAADPDDPAENIEAGVRLLRDLLLRYRDDPYQLRLALAAYNAGPGAVARYGGVPPYRETQSYVERVLREFRAAAKKAASDVRSHRRQNGG